MGELIGNFEETQRCTKILFETRGNGLKCFSPLNTLKGTAKTPPVDHLSPGEGGGVLIQV